MGKTTKKDLVGKQYGRLTVLYEIYERNKHGHIMYMCSCSCGNTKAILGSSLREVTRSCGCLQRESATTHGLEKTSTYKTYQSMHQRCYNQNNTRYIDWGGRGIKVSPEWHTFEQFYKDMGDKPKGMTIERIDNDADYSKKNCRWATYKDQASNRRNSIKILWESKMYSIKEYSKLIGLSESGTRKRVYRDMIKNIDGVFVKEGDTV